jgi:hypothetical protein
MWYSRTRPGGVPGARPVKNHLFATIRPISCPKALLKSDRAVEAPGAEQTDQMGTEMTGEPKKLQAHQTLHQTSAANLTAEAPERGPDRSDRESDIDLDRVVYDPYYRDWARDQLNHTP